MANTDTAEVQVTAAEALLAAWGPSFPARADVEAAATAFLPVPWRHEPGPRHLLHISPGVIRLESADLDKRYFTAQRARRAAEAKAAMGARHPCHDPGCSCEGRGIVVHPDPDMPADRASAVGHWCEMKGCPTSADDRFRMDHGCPELCEPGCLHHPAPSRMVTYFSGKSKCRMIRVFAELDYTPLVAPGRVSGIGTLTLPGKWLEVAPTAKKWKKILDKFRKRWIPRGVNPDAAMERRVPEARCPPLALLHVRGPRCPGR